MAKYHHMKPKGYEQINVSKRVLRARKEKERTDLF
jgi:hypothetical protein